MSWREAERAYSDAVIGESTLPALFEESAERHADATFQRYKGGVYDRSLTPTVVPKADPGTFASLDYRAVRHVVRRLSTGLRSLGATHGDRIAIYADTRMEWAQSDLAILAAGGVVTTMYADASPGTVEYLLQDADVEGVIAGNAEQVERVRAAEGADPSFVVVMDEDSRDRSDEYTLEELYKIGDDAFEEERYRARVAGVTAQDLATLVYTSGTTGEPKGVRLTHRNLRSNVNGIRKRYGPRPDKPSDLPRIDENAVAVSFLPLAHIFERTAGHFTMIAAGATVAYAESPDTLREDFSAVRPTVATSVPRVYEKIYGVVRAEAQSSRIRSRIFHWAVDVGKAAHRADAPGVGLRLRHAIADRLVFSRVRAALGGRIRMLISGGGSLSPDLAALYHGMGLPVYEGYGLTETSPVVTCNPIEAPQVGTIGPPLVDVEIRIEDTPTPEQEAPGEAGELYVRGPNVSNGYWNKPGRTARAFDEEGWFRTGDIVRRRPDGYLEFVERAKELLVLSTGKNVAPGPIEDAFATSDVIEQCMVVGEDRKFVGALIVPNEEAIRRRLDGVVLPEDRSELCRHDAVERLLDEAVEVANEGFDPHETIKRYRVIPEEFSTENGLLTPTMKKRRGDILDAYASEVEAIYETP